MAPSPETVQEQVDNAIDLGLDGIIIYGDQAGQEPMFFSAGLKNKITQVPANPHALFKIGSFHKRHIPTAVTKDDKDQSSKVNLFISSSK